MERATQEVAGDSPLFCLRHEHRKNHGSWRIDSHRGRDLGEIEVGVEIFHICDGVYGDTAAPNFAICHRMVGVNAQQCRHVECC